MSQIISPSRQHMEMMHDSQPCTPRSYYLSHGGPEDRPVRCLSVAHHHAVVRLQAGEEGGEVRQRGERRGELHLRDRQRG